LVKNLPAKIAAMVKRLGGKVVKDVNAGNRQHMSFEFDNADDAWQVYQELLARRPKRHLLGLPILRPHVFVEMEVEKHRVTNIVLVARVHVRGHTETGRKFVKELREHHKRIGGRKK